MTDRRDDGSDPLQPGSRLPEEIETVIAEVLLRARLDPASERATRSDLEQHFRDGLDRGRSAEDLVRRFGDPAVAGPLLARSPAPSRGIDGGSSDSRGGRGRGRVFEALASDLRLAVRGLLKAPSLALTATVVLALGVGANTVVFTVVNELLLRPLAVREPETLVDVWADIPGGNSFLGISYLDFETYRDQNTALDGLIGFMGRRLDFDRSGATQEVVGQFVSPGYFEMLGLTPTLGRASFDPSGRFGEPPVAVLTHAFWTESFGADPGIIGTTIRLQEQAVTVIGVGPPGFSGHFIGFPSQLWLPITAADPLIAGWDAEDRSQKELEMIGRLRPGVDVGVARAALNSLAQEIERQYPDVNRGHRVGVSSTTGLDHSLQAGVTAFVAILSAVSLMVLVIACLNVGSVLLVRAMAREREVAVRIALGAGRGRLLRQLITESALLVALGAAAGILVAVRLNRGLAELLRIAGPGLGLELGVDGRVLLLTALTALGAALLASVAPALHMLRSHPSSVLRARGGSSRTSARLRATLVVGQVATSVVLVIATGLFVRALVAGAGSDPGFDADQVAAFVLDAPVDGSREIVAALAAIPGVAAVTVASHPPVGVARSPLPIEIPGVLPPPGADRLVVDARTVGPGYLATLGVPLQAGRDVREEDRSGPRVAVVSRAFAERFWPGADPLGRSFHAGDSDVRVIGVAQDTRYLVQDDSPDPLVYLSDAGAGGGSVVVTLRAFEPLRLGDAVQRTIATAVPGHRRIQLRSARQVLDDALLPQRLGAVIIGAMGLAALFLAAVGLYGLVQFTVARDTHEFGVRLALGGGPRDLLRVVLQKGFRLVALGAAIGVAAALLVMPGLADFLVGVSPADPLTYLGVVGCFALVAAVASWLPARRALRIEATEALRGDG